MSEESATLRAITWTRFMLDKLNNDLRLLAYMAANDVSPDDIEDVATEILEYLEKTKEEKEPHKPDGKIIQEALRLLDDWEKAGLGDYIVNGKYVDVLRAMLEGKPHG